MTGNHAIEVFTAGCALCDDALETVKRIAPTATITVHDMGQGAALKRAEELGVRSVPAVAIDGALAACCSGRGVDEAVLATALAQ